MKRGSCSTSGVVSGLSAICAEYGAIVCDSTLKVILIETKFGLAVFGVVG
jgi:hypothetical protein